ncbi:MAG TPA: S8 family serine peptidase, partial [Chitinophagaceae bacterium]|nr:S8 family serine peptidase [Chitinophagaceae bacterium]
MKPHIIVKLKEGVEPVTAPYWADFIDNKSTAVESLDKLFDEALRKRKMKFWVTSEFKPHKEDEYRPQFRQWSKEEIESGLNRIYRIILQEDTDIPPQLIEEIKLIPAIEKATPGRIGVARLPEAGLTLSMDANLNKPAQQIFLEEAQLFSKGSPSVKIAVLDTGVDLTHPEIAQCMLNGMDFVDILDGADRFIGDFLGEDAEPLDEVGHGTHVTGILCSKGSKMPQGVVPDCKIIPVRVLGAM